MNRGSSSFDRVDHEASAVGLHNAAGDRHTDARSRVRCGTGGEGGEDCFLLILGNACPRVFNGDECATVFGGCD